MNYDSDFMSNIISKGRKKRKVNSLNLLVSFLVISYALLLYGIVFLVR